MKTINVTKKQLEEAKNDYVNNLISLKMVSKKHGIPEKKLGILLKDVVRTLGEANLAARKKNPNLYKITNEMKKKISIKLIEYNKKNKLSYHGKLRKPYKKESNPEKVFRRLVEKTNLEWEQYFYIDELDRRYEIDFAIPNRRLLFEINGPYHYMDNGGFTEYHLSRKKEIENCDYQMIDVHYEDVFNYDKITKILIEVCGDITFNNPKKEILTYKRKKINFIKEKIKNSNINFKK